MCPHPKHEDLFSIAVPLTATGGNDQTMWLRDTVREWQRPAISKKSAWESERDREWEVDWHTGVKSRLETEPREDS
jgi:hypothetical protein